MAWFKLKPQLLIIILLVGGLAALALFDLINLASRPLPRRPLTAVIIDGRTIRAETVSAAADLYRGLSYRPSLCSDCGMLFLFPDHSVKEFVMRYMKFPLDIIFINNGLIVKIAANLPPEGGPPNTIYDSGGPSDRVLEVGAGTSRQFNWRVGDAVQFKNN